jgi:FixJ family two-component response regulator
MSAFTSKARTVQLVERNDRERQVLQQFLESIGLHVEPFTSLVERTTDMGECLIWSLDGASSRPEELDRLVAEMRDGTSVVLLGSSPPMALVVRLVKAGAVDVLCKPVELTELRRAVLEAFERCDAEREQRSRLHELQQRIDRLTVREQEVFQRLITGQLNKQVGAELGITERTVKAHRASILRKVAVGSVAELVRVATTIEFGCQQPVERHTNGAGPVLAPADQSVPLPA